MFPRIMELQGLQYLHHANRIYEVRTCGDRWVFVADVTEELDRAYANHEWAELGSQQPE